MAQARRCGLTPDIPNRFADCPVREYGGGAGATGQGVIDRSIWSVVVKVEMVAIMMGRNGYSGVGAGGGGGGGVPWGQGLFAPGSYDVERPIVLTGGAGGRGGAPGSAAGSAGSAGSPGSSGSVQVVQI